MAQNALVVKSVMDDGARFYAVGIETPSVRVFNSATGELHCTVEIPKSSRSQKGAGTSTSFGTMLNPPVLTAIAIGAIGNDEDSDEQDYILAGFSDGCVVVHNLVENVTKHHVAVSDTMQPIAALCACRGTPYFFAAAKNRLLTVGDASTGAVLVRNIPINAVAGSVAATKVVGAGEGAVYVLVCGALNVLWKLHVPSHTNGGTMERCVTFSGGSNVASAASFCWLSRTNSSTTSLIAATAVAAEGCVRVWDVDPAENNPRKSDRIRRTLQCGHRISNVSILHNDQNEGESSVVAVTTFVGTVLLWKVKELAPRVGEVVPLPPTATFHSKDQQHGRLLCCGVNENAHGALVFVRGKYAMPFFEGFTKHLGASAAVRGGETVMLPFLNKREMGRLDGDGGDEGEDDEEEAALRDTWALQASAATKALVTSGGDQFAEPKIFHAESTKALAALTAHEEEAASTPKERGVMGGGVAAVALYQALHANDTSLVMELLTLSSATPQSMEHTVRALKLPYVLQLFRILSQRLTTVGARSPLHAWVGAILRCRAKELKAVQTAFDENKTSSEEKTHDDPRTFIAPLMARYEGVVAQQHKLATLFGRLSAFRAVRPRLPMHNMTATEKRAASATIFPNEFRDSVSESRGRSAKSIVIAGDKSWDVVRVKQGRADEGDDDDENEEFSEDEGPQPQKANILVKQQKKKKKHREENEDMEFGDVIADEDGGVEEGEEGGYAEVAALPDDDLDEEEGSDAGSGAEPEEYPEAEEGEEGEEEEAEEGEEREEEESGSNVEEGGEEEIPDDDGNDLLAGNIDVEEEEDISQPRRGHKKGGPKKKRRGEGGGEPFQGYGAAELEDN